MKLLTSVLLAASTNATRDIRLTASKASLDDIIRYEPIINIKP